MQHVKGFNFEVCSVENLRRLAEWPGDVGKNATEELLLREADKVCDGYEALRASLSLCIRTMNDTLRHGLTQAQREAMAETLEKASTLLVYGVGR